MKQVALILAWWPATIFAMICGNGVAVKGTGHKPVVYVIMAISSMGKSTQGQKLAQYLGTPFYEPDDFHTPENRAKISSGIPLTDDERWPWLDRMRVEVIEKHLSEQTGAVMANSALRRIYRERLGIPRDGVQLIYLRGSKEMALSHNQSRAAHFAPAQTVLNNLAILEEPLPEENAVVVDVDPRGVEYTFHRILTALGFI